MRSQLTFSTGDCHFDGIFSSEEKIQLPGIAAGVFDKWRTSARKGGPLDPEVPVKATFVRRSDGRSGAAVYQLSFTSKYSEDIAPGTFIVKLHTGDRASETSTRERTVADLLAQAGSHYFASKIIDVHAALPNNVVVYQHVKDFWAGKTPRTLEERLADILADPEAGGELATAISEFLAGIHYVFTNQFENAPRPISGRGYFDRVALRLIPELIVNAKKNATDTYQLSDRTLTLECNGSVPSKSANVEVVAEDLVLRPERWIDRSNPRWLEIIGVPIETTDVAATGRFLFLAEGSPFWILLRETDATSLAECLAFRAPHRIILNTSALETGSALLQSLGFDEQSRLLPRELIKFLEPIQGTNIVWRHADLHGQNVLGIGRHLAAIDLAGIGEDNPAVCAARLETSLWYKATHALGLTDKELALLLSSLESGDLPRWEGERPILKGIHAVYSAIRKSVRDASPLETTIAYATQVLIHQRHAVTYYRTRHVPSCFILYSRHWLNRLREITSTSPFREEPSTATVSPTDIVTVRNLWNKALTSEYGFLDPRSEAVLAGISRADAAFESPLLPLQAKLWKESTVESPFESSKHVILAGPTGSGKTTLAEMFLLRPALLNTDRTCSLYIAPTRALTQAKFRDLRERFGNDAELKNNIIISTGEDNEFDHRLSAGDFSIACLVFEKANIVFSLNPRVLHKIACLVVDEVHMLGDLDRGPILELALTKVHQDRKASDFTQTRDDEKECVRLVLITTEDEADDAVLDFLTTPDPRNPIEKARPPLVYRDTRRPVPSIHHVVLAGKTPNSNQDPLDFIAFDDSEKRYLKEPQLKGAATRLRSPYEVARKEARVKGEMYGRVVEFLCSHITGQPNGYRIIVFLPGRSDIEVVAESLLGRLHRELPEGGASSNTDNIMDRIARLEDQKLRPLLSRCVNAGIFVHHSDIERTIREETEHICSSVDVSAPPQIILATETLTYGVNLAIQDVLLMGVRFNTQNRQRVRTRAPLTACGFHNMVGRAGRFGKLIAPEANVYVLLDRPADPFKEIVARYYTRPTQLNSRLFVKDDLDPMVGCLQKTRTRSREDGADLSPRFLLLACTTFTYPFSRAVLDALRHLNISISRDEDSTLRTAVDAGAVYGLLQNSLYGADVLRRHADIEELMFKHAIKRIVEHCADPSLRLTVGDTADPPRYMITARGESVIDTGTELSTVEPLLRFVSEMRSAWKALGRTTDVPVELYIPCLIALTEIRKQYIRYCPECKVKDAKWSPDAAAANDQHVDVGVALLLRDVLGEEGDGALLMLRGLLRRWLPPNEARAAYDGGTGAAVMRYFGAVLAWVNGQSLEQVHGQVESAAPELAPDRFGGHLRGFRQFTELLYYKARCLARLLSKDDLNVISLSDEVRLYMLAARIRYGCTETAIPLFWPQSSSFTRPEASYLLNRGIVPAAILRSSSSRHLLIGDKQMDVARFDGLKQDLKRFVVAEMRDLKAELSSHLVGSEDIRDLMTLQLWQTILATFESSVIEYTLTEAPTVDLDRALRDSFSRMASQTPLMSKGGIESKHRTRLEVHGGSVLWTDEERCAIEGGSASEYRKNREICLRGVTLREGWSEGQLSRLLQAEQRTKHLVIVTLPWLPPATTMPSGVVRLLAERSRMVGATTTFLTGAAFATICTLIVRALVLSPAPIFNMLTKPSANGSAALVGIPDIYSELEGLIDWPSGSMREALLRHFEISGKEDLSSLALAQTAKGSS